MDEDHANSDAFTESEYERLEAQYQSRKATLQHVIDVLASYEDSTLESHGTKAEVAREHDIEQHRIHYVLNHWADLVRYRRHANRDPLDPESVKAAYEDDTMRAMAEAGRAPVADGAGDLRVDVELTLDEVFRAIKLLPGDLGLKVYSQALSADIPRDQIRRILEGSE